MADETRSQLLQFFEDCLFSDACLGSKPDGLDLEALVDSELSAEENWEENIKPRLQLLQDDDFSYMTEEKVRAEIEKYENLASKHDDLDFEVSMP